MPQSNRTKVATGLRGANVRELGLQSGVNPNDALGEAVAQASGFTSASRGEVTLEFNGKKLGPYALDPDGKIVFQGQRNYFITISAPSPKVDVNGVVHQERGVNVRFDADGLLKVDPESPDAPLIMSRLTALRQFHIGGDYWLLASMQQIAKDRAKESILSQLDSNPELLAAVQEKLGARFAPSFEMEKPPAPGRDAAASAASQAAKVPEVAPSPAKE